MLSIPAVTPPAFMAVNGKGGSTRINGNTVFFAQITDSFIQGSFISKSKSPLHSAIWAMRRRRNFYLFIENKILFSYFKTIFAIFTNFLHSQF